MWSDLLQVLWTRGSTLIPSLFILTTLFLLVDHTGISIPLHMITMQPYSVCCSTYPNYNYISTGTTCVGDNDAFEVGLDQNIKKEPISFHKL